MSNQPVSSNPKDLLGVRKAPLRFVPWSLMLGVSEAMRVGAGRYGPFNWRSQPVSAMTYVEAIQRHLAAWVDGQENAEDTGVHHLKHIGASVAILLDAMGIEGGLLDDRPTPGPAANLLRALDRSVPLIMPLSLKEAVAPMTEEQVNAEVEYALNNVPQTLKERYDRLLRPERIEDALALLRIDPYAILPESYLMDESPVVTDEPWGTGDGTIYAVPPTGCCQCGWCTILV